jgi:hypothetical protein
LQAIQNQYIFSPLYNNEMIFILAEEGATSAKKVAQLVSLQSEIFKAISIAALKARASMLDPGKVIKFGGFEFVVDENEFGEGIVVSIILPRPEIELLGMAKAEELGVDVKDMSGTQYTQWICGFMNSLKENLEKWYEIKCIQGPGDNLTFEKSAYRKESRPWK